MVDLKSLEGESLSATEHAAAWFARQRSGNWTHEDAARFATWLKANPSHARAWTSYERLWGRVESVRDNPRILAIREQARSRAAGRAYRRRGWGWGATLAASIVLAITVVWGVRTSVKPLALSPIAQTDHRDTAESSLIREAETQVGQRSTLVLADGSKVTLNTASAVRADYRGQERHVTLLHGEAFFDVAQHSSRPFVVWAGSRQVIALGTAFAVRLQDHAVKVTLVEGKVKVVTQPSREIKSTPAVVLKPGSALLARDDGMDRVESLDAIRATSWRRGRLVFDGEPLADVVAEMNRYSQEKLVIGNPALQGRRVSGVFDPAGGPGFASALEAYGIARPVRQTPTTIVLDLP